MAKGTTHKEQLPFLRKIEGQIRGIQKMIDDERYCVDILTQLHSVVGAIHGVENKVLAKHLKGCVAEGMKRESALEHQKKIDEVIDLLKRFRK